jgi:arginine deiminase
MHLSWPVMTLSPEKNPSYPNSIQARQRTEWDTARFVLLCEPRFETLFALLETNSANFLRPFSIEQAQREHRAFRQLLEAKGITVMDVREALTYGASQGPSCEALTRLQNWALQSVRYDTSALSAADAHLLVENLCRTIEVFDPATLVDLILLRPWLTITYNPQALDPTSRFVSRFEVSPASNLYYMRDPMITTQRGCVIGRLRLDVRRGENDIAQSLLEQLGIVPIYRVQAPGFLEGGDFLPAGDFVLQGQGLLSDADGVGQCLEHRVYGHVEVAVVKDPRSQMDEMHLDTYFSLLGPDLCALCEDRLQTGQEPVVDVYRPHGGETDFRYRLVKTVGFAAYLAEKGMRVITFSKEEQHNFAANGLLIAPYHLIGVRQAGSAYENRLRQHQVQTRFIPFDALTGGYGGPHCCSQVILRA